MTKEKGTPSTGQRDDGTDPQSTNSPNHPGFFSDAANDILAIVNGAKTGDWKRVFDALLAEDERPSTKRRRTTYERPNAQGFGILCFDGVQPETGPSRGRTGGLDQISRMKVAEVRDQGACYRCQVQKKSVSARLQTWDGKGLMRC